MSMVSIKAYASIQPTDRVTLADDRDLQLNDVHQPTGRAARLVVKPDGLWYASGTQWIDWVEQEMPDWKYKSDTIPRQLRHIYKIEITDSVLQISTEQQFLEFDQQYKTEGNMPDTDLIDWPAVASDYSGVEIIPYQGKFRHSHFWYWGWDVASGCAWNKNGIKSLTFVE